MAKARVCHMTSVHSAFDNRILHKECISLVRAEFDVFLVAPLADPQEFEGVHIVPVMLPRRRIFRMTIGVWKVFRKALSLKACIYHFHDPELIPAGIALRLLGKKVVADVHENTPAALLSRPYLSSTVARIVSWFIGGIEKLAMYAMSAVITARPDISSRLSVHSPVTLHNFPVLPDIEAVPKAFVPGGKQGVIYVGGISKIRGIIELIAAFELLENAELWLLGPFEREAFRKECESTPGWRNTRYLGVTSPQGIFPYLKAATIGIITFLPFPNHITTLATKPFEYMAAGLPMIMSDFDYWKNFFGEASLYVDPSDSRGIAKAVTTLLSDPELRIQMGNRNRMLALTKYSWAAEEGKLLSLYEQLSHSCKAIPANHE